MAGAKETPRQKMIGMMYLVLTALLALQVSNAVLEKFIFIDQTLQRQVKENTEKNRNVLKAIENEVSQKGDRKEDVAVLDKAKQVRQMTSTLVEDLNALREKMVTITGGRDANGNLIGAKDYDKVGTMMIHGGEGKKLREKLNSYAADLSKLAGRDFDAIAKDAKDIDIAKNDPNQNLKSFSEYYFQNTPTAAGMATISQMETEVLNYESLALDQLANQVGAKDLSFDLIFPVVLPESNIVAAGTKFKGELFITAASSAVDPEMRINRNTGSNYPEDADEEVPVDEGKGQIEFTATPGNYDKDGYAEKKFKAYITMSDSTYEYEHIYKVAKPVIQIQSAAIQSLYLNCGNELNVQVPALGSAYNPSFSVSGGTAIKGSQKGIVTVIPTAPKVALTVRSGGNLIGTENFTVRRVPKPHIEISDRGRPINLKTGVKAPGPPALSLRAVPDETFASLLPKDARYRVAEAEIILARGSRPVKRETIRGKETISMSAYRALAKPGDRIVIEVKRVQRMNYQNKVENVGGLPSTVFTISLH